MSKCHSGAAWKVELAFPTQQPGHPVSPGCLEDRLDAVQAAELNSMAPLLIIGAPPADEE
jgi:hypothetical protein